MATDEMKGRRVLRTPLLNKGTAFTGDERRELGLEGLLPAFVSDIGEQSTRAYSAIANLSEPLAKYRELAALQDRNEYLFYRVLLDHLAELMPIVYTPTVGEAAQKFSHVFQRGRGLWISPDHQGRIAEVIETAVPDCEAKLLVVTDNESILGLGDQGAGGMTISIGKLALYTACAGIAPEHTLPISLDVGTDNEGLLASPTYLGWPEKRLRGAQYEDFVEEFVTAVERLFPRALVQWEDFRKDNALAILDRYRHRVLSFNDDIQGTGAVTLAGVYSALRIADRPIANERFVVLGAGAAGLGIARQIKAALRSHGVAHEQIERHIGVIDSRGVIVSDNEHRDAYKAELAWSVGLAQELGLEERRDLESVVGAFQPTVLIGTSGQPGAFTETIVRSMAATVDRPIVMPLSNPTANAEAVPSDILEWTAGTALVATGSPFAPVEIDGQIRKIGQGNNVFIFPALGLGALLAGAREVTDAMIDRAASALAETLLPEELEQGMLYPEVERLREVTAAMATAVVDQAVTEGVASAELPADVADYVASSMWRPEYP